MSTLKLTKEGLEVVKEVLEHWKRMVKYVKNGGSINKVIMEKELGENYLGKYCNFCEIYFSNCRICLLGLIGQRCGDPDSLWDKVDKVSSKKGWLKNARLLVRALNAMVKDVKVRSIYNKNELVRLYSVGGCNRAGTIWAEVFKSMIETEII